MPTCEHPIVRAVRRTGVVPALTIPELRRVCFNLNAERLSPLRVDPLVYYLLRISARESLWPHPTFAGPNGGVVLFGLEFLPY